MSCIVKHFWTYWYTNSWFHGIIGWVTSYSCVSTSPSTSKIQTPYFSMTIAVLRPFLCTRGAKLTKQPSDMPTPTFKHGLYWSVIQHATAKPRRPHPKSFQPDRYGDCITNFLNHRSKLQEKVQLLII